MKQASVLVQELDACTRQYMALNNELSEHQLHYKINAKTWSILEVIAHVITTDTLVFNELEFVIKENSGKPKKPTRFSWFENWFLKKINPESKLKLPAPSIYKPPTDTELNRREVFESFVKHQERFKKLIQNAENSDQTLKVRSPYTALVRMSIAAWIELGLKHQCRHMHQIERIMKKIPTG